MSAKFTVCLLIWAATVISASVQADIFFESEDAAMAASEDGRFYGGVGVAALFFEAPKRRNVGTIYEDADPPIVTINIHNFEPSETTPVLGVMIGQVFRPGNYGRYGSNLRAELSGHYFSADDSLMVSRAPPLFTSFLAIDGTGHVDDPSSPGNTIEGNFKADYDYWDLGFRLRSDFPL